MFPHIPTAAIHYDLQKTGSVEQTCDNILRDGALPMVWRTRKIRAAVKELSLLVEILDESYKIECLCRNSYIHSLLPLALLHPRLHRHHRLQDHLPEPVNQ